MPEVLVTAENIHKKFCRSLKRSLWYGVKDLGADLSGRRNGRCELRKDEFWAVENVSFELREGDTLGLIGRNGAGKTTLLRMLNGLIKPDKGSITVRGRMQALIALGAGFNPLLTGRENIFVNAAVLGIPKKEVVRRFDEIVEFSGVGDFIDAPVQSYSSGMAVRLGFAVAAHMNPDVLLIDEVLAVGDEGFQTKCLNKVGELKKNGTAIVLVSHNMHTISTFSQKVMLLEKGSHRVFDNAYEGVAAYRKLFLEGNELDIERFTSGNRHIRFYQGEPGKQVFRPGESFSITVHYESSIEYREVEIDIAMRTNRESWIYFQATNKAYRREINLLKGTHELRIEVKDIRINNAVATMGIAIWAKDRTELLFWWRIPLEFKGVDHSAGNNFLDVVYETD